MKRFARKIPLKRDVWPASCCELSFVSRGGKENERNCVHSCQVLTNFFPSRPLPYSQHLNWFHLETRSRSAPQCRPFKLHTH
jgi:hypothetical protein